MAVERVTSAGFAFISVDYRLIPPSTGHEIIEDIKDLFRFLALDFNRVLLQRATEAHIPFQVDPDSIAVSGTSAGGLCAYLAVMHAKPLPKALLGLYAMGGDYTVRLHHGSRSCDIFELLLAASAISRTQDVCFLPWQGVTRPSKLCRVPPTRMSPA